MCDFKEKYGQSFNMVLEFMKRHYGVYTDSEWEAVCSEIGRFKSDLEVALALAVINEFERVYMAMEKGDFRLSDNQKTHDIENNYRAIFERTYRFARKCYRADMSKATALQDAKTELEKISTRSPFEYEITRACCKIFIEDCVGVQ